MAGGAKTIEEFAQRYFERLQSVLAGIDPASIAQMAEALESARVAQRTVFLAGNGGSAATAAHMATDLGMSDKANGFQPLLRTVALTENSAILTAMANDFGYDHIFVSQLRTHYRPGDHLVVVSASGNSPNVIAAARWVKAQGGKVLGFLGFNGGALLGLCDVTVHVKTTQGEYGAVEDAHLTLNHLLTSWLRQRVQEQGRIQTNPPRSVRRAAVPSR